MPIEPLSDYSLQRRALLGAGVSSLAGVAGCGQFFANGSTANAAKGSSFDARRSKKYLDRICRLGPRPSGSKGMLAQQKIIIKHFEGLGAKIGKQEFTRPNPLTRGRADMMNLIVSWHPESKERVLLACHYDTRPFPDRDPRFPRGVFVGANDGASGVALFMEMGHHMKNIKPTFGVDFVFFDAEEFVVGKDAPIKNYFVGSKHFATEYKKNPPKHKYHYGVVADMVADRDLNLYLEPNSMRYASALTMSIWNVARDLRIREFIRAKYRHEIEDDHLPLNRIAKIPSCDIIDFDYPPWHTTRDTPAQCSGESLSKVGRVLLKWLEKIPRPG